MGISSKFIIQDISGSSLSIASVATELNFAKLYIHISVGKGFESAQLELYRIT
jgi:hypothetical protein